jgi:glycosyltransferase involved in cell wall biosynthesis
MAVQDSVRILIVLETPAIDGVGKPMLEFAAQACRLRSGGASSGPALDISFAIFARHGSGFDNPLTRSARACGVSIYPIDERYVFDLRVVAKLRDAVQRSKADIVITNGAKTHFLMRIAGLDRGLCRWVAFHHGDTSTNTKVLIYNEMGRWAIRRAERVLTSCYAFATQLEREGIRGSRIRIQYMPIRPFAPAATDVTDQLRRKLELPENTPVLVTVGRLSREKGQADLIRAVAQLRDQGDGPQPCLVIVGDGADMDRLSHLSRKLGVSGIVRLVGFQPNVGEYLGIADLFVLPSYSEGCPNALLEAMAAGIPVVATSVGGVPEIVKNEHNALLVRSGDIGGMAAAISRLLRDKVLGARLTVAARSVLESHAPEIYFRSMISNLGIGSINGSGSA